MSSKKKNSRRTPVRRINVDSIEDPIVASQKYTLLSYLVPGYNMDERFRGGVIVRGAFPDTESAKEGVYALPLQLHTMVAVTGRPTPSRPTQNQMEECPRIYREKELQEIVGDLDKRNEEGERAWREQEAEQTKAVVTRDILEKQLEKLEGNRRAADEHIACLEEKLARLRG